MWTDTPDLCQDYAGVLREIVTRLKCKGYERPAGEDRMRCSAYLGLLACLIKEDPLMNYIFVESAIGCNIARGYSKCFGQLGIVILFLR